MASSQSPGTFTVKTSDLKANDYIMLDGRPCKITDISIAKTGKHGAAKVMLTGIDIFTGSKNVEANLSSRDSVAPVVSSREFQLVDVTDEGILSLKDDQGTMKNDIKIPEGEVGEKIKSLHAGGKEVTVTVLSAVGQEAAVDAQEASGN